MITNTTTASLQADLQLVNKTKATGLTGPAGQIALQVGLIQETTSPMITQPHIVIFAAITALPKRD